MPSPKLIQILRSRTDLTDEQIIPLSDGESWAIIRKIDEDKRKNRPPKRPEVCFTGFNKKEKEALEVIADKKGFDSKGSVTKILKYLVIGETAGEIKIKKAETQGVKILRKKEFEDVDDRRWVIITKTSIY